MSPKTARHRCLLLVVAVLLTATQAAGRTQETATPTSESATPPIFSCGAAESVCEVEGVTSELLDAGASPDGEQWWTVSYVSFQPGAGVQPTSDPIPTRYALYVESGTIALTAAVPVICSGVCRVEAPITAGTPAALSQGGTIVPPGVEVHLDPGDVAMFEESGDQAHVYTNVGPGPAHFLSTVSGIAAPDSGGATPASCRRCLRGF